MAGHDIIVIGASAGGLDPLRSIVAGLPRDLPAAVFIVQHVAATGVSLLPELLAHAGELPAFHAHDGMQIEHSHVYVAPPDNHMLIRRGHIHVVRGPKENGFRPAIDATFRTAAQSYGPRTIGIVLSGMLDDGTAGLLAIKRRGGVAVVQDPAEAAYPSMPQSACRYVAVDTTLPAADMSALIVRLAHTPIIAEGDTLVDEQLDLEAGISAGDKIALDLATIIGETVPFSCPDCDGVLVEYYDGDLLRFRCQVGHVYSRESMFAQHAEMLDRSLWAAFNKLDERAHLAQRLANDAHRYHDASGEQRFTRHLQQLEWQKEQVRQAMLKDDHASVR